MTRDVVVKQLIEILALGKAIKVNILLEGKKMFLRQGNASLEISYGIFLRILVLLLFTQWSIEHQPIFFNIA